VRKCSVGLSLFIATLFTAGQAHSQARQEMKYRYLQDQIIGTYQHTFDDYNLQLLDGTVEQIHLNGGAVEFAWNKFYPVEIIVAASYSAGQPEGQKLMTFTGGAGYTRIFAKRYNPFVHVGAGLARTSSDDKQYLYETSKSSFFVDCSGGIDVLVSKKHWGVRPINVEVQYLPFGVQDHSSTYLSFGAGAFYRF
jgi:hypothetical protein